MVFDVSLFQPPLGLAHAHLLFYTALGESEFAHARPDVEGARVVSFRSFDVPACSANSISLNRMMEIRKRKGLKIEAPVLADYSECGRCSPFL